MYKFLVFLHSDLKVYSIFCFKAYSGLRAQLCISLVIVPMFTRASGEREDIEKDNVLKWLGEFY